MLEGNSEKEMASDDGWQHRDAGLVTFTSRPNTTYVRPAIEKNHDSVIHNPQDEA